MGDFLFSLLIKGLIKMMFQKWLLTAVSCAAFTLSACGGGGQQQNTATPTPASTPATASQTNSGGGDSNGNNGNKVLRVAMNAEFAPFEFMDANQKPQGFDVDLVQALAKQGNFQVEIQHKPWDSLFPALANGDIDVIASAVTITDDRKKTMDFSEPYYQIKQVVLVPATKKIANMEDLKKMPKVGVVTGNTGDFAAQKIFGATSPNIARFENVTLLIKEVENGGVDAAISDSAVVANYIKNNSDKGFTMVEVPDFDVENYGLVVRKGDAETLAKLNDALKAIRENGEYKQIESKYFAQ